MAGSGPKPHRWRKRSRADQINWKPSPSEWSIAQCLEHLILLNTPYFPQIEIILAGQRKASLWERVPLLPAFFGRLDLAAVQPGSKQKVKARPAFEPVSSYMDIGILTRFSTHQGDLIRLMKATAELPIEKDHYYFCCFSRCDLQSFGCLPYSRCARAPAFAAGREGDAGARLSLALTIRLFTSPALDLSPGTYIKGNADRVPKTLHSCRCISPSGLQVFSFCCWTA
jgi:hypothetical protein